MTDLSTSNPVVSSSSSLLTSTTSSSSLLVLVLDLDPLSPFFLSRSPERGFLHALDASLALAHAHAMMDTEASVAAVAAHRHSATFLYPSEDGGPSEGDRRQRDGQFELFHHFEAAVRHKMADIVAQDLRSAETPHATSQASLTAGALCKALTYVNRWRRTREKAKARILVVSSSSDSGGWQYMNLMNAFFSAQRLHVIIDVCLLAHEDSGLLQQGADITQGVYRRIREKDFPALLQFLLWLYLPNHGLRSKLSLPTNKGVDYRAACFCHRQLVDVGFVCSVCLSIFCKFSPICTTCSTVFKAPMPNMAGKKRKMGERKT